MLEFSDDKKDVLQEKWQSPIEAWNNDDMSGEAGVEAHLNVNLGFAVLLGVEVGGSTDYTYHFSHRILADEKDESMTTISVEFGDSECLSTLSCC